MQVTEIDGLKFLVHPKDVHLYDDVKEGLDEFGAKPSVVVDLGAHVGFLSLQAAKLDASFILAYEPSPRNFFLLFGNIQSNSFGHSVIPFRLAVTDVSFDVVGLMTTDAKETITTAQQGLEFKHDYPVVCFVPTISLIDVLTWPVKRFGKVDYLKIDIEGSEWRIFKEPPDPILVELLSHVSFVDMEWHFLFDKTYYNFIGSPTDAEIKTSNLKHRLLNDFESFGFKIKLKKNEIGFFARRS